MSEQIREQVSAFLDGELPNSEAELLLKRLTRDGVLRESFGRYALIGESMRGVGPARLSQGFHARVNRAIDGEPVGLEAPTVGARRSRLWRPFAGAGVAAGVAAVAMFALQQRAIAPTTEAVAYTVPAAVSEPPTAMPAARLTNYVFAHSKYSSVLGQSNVLSELLTDADDRNVGTATAVRSP